MVVSGPMASPPLVRLSRVPSCMGEKARLVSLGTGVPEDTGEEVGVPVGFLPRSLTFLATLDTTEGPGRWLSLAVAQASGQIGLTSSPFLGSQGP